MSGSPSNPNQVKMLPGGDAGGGGPAGGGAPPGAPSGAGLPAVYTIVSGAVSVPVATRQLADLPKDELDNLAEEYGLEPRKFKTPQDLVTAIHERRQLIASLDREALVDIVRWGRRPVPINATAEQLAFEIHRIKSMRFEGLSERGLVALARLRGVELEGGESIPLLVKKLKRQEGFFARLNRKRRAVLGAIVSNMLGENGASSEYQFLPPQEGGTGAGGATTTATPASTATSGVPTGTGPLPAPRERSIKEEIEESGLFGGIASRVKKTADQYINQKLDEIESRIDRKLDEIDRRLAEWRDKEIANRLRILKITLWASVIVASLSLLYAYVNANFVKRPSQPAQQPPASTARP